MRPPTARSLLRRHFYVPWTPLPEGRMVELPGRGGSTYVTDTPGPEPDSPAVVLLHALGCTGLLTWFPAIRPLARTHRVVTLDLRWHGRGICSSEFSVHDCADDVGALIELLELGAPIVAGYSMGSIVAQRTWRRHPHLTGGLVLCATTDRFRATVAEQLFHRSMEAAMLATRQLAHSRTAVRRRLADGRVTELEPADIHDWVLAEFRSTSPWAMGQAVAALGRHHSRPWLPEIDVPTAVVLTRRDRVLPPRHQRAVASRIPGATVHEVDSGHACCVLESERFVPVLLEAVGSVTARMRGASSASSP